MPKKIQESKGLVIYQTSKPGQEELDESSNLLFPNAVPDHHKELASNVGKEDAEYYSDVQNITKRQKMIRLSTETPSFFHGWVMEDKYIGAKILYPTLTEEIKQDLFENKTLQQLCLVLAVDELQKMGTFTPVNVEIHEPNSALLSWMRIFGLTKGNKVDEYNDKLQRQIERQRQKMHAYIHGLVADLSSRTVIRFAAFVTNNILVRMYNQGIHIKSSEFIQVQNCAFEAEKNGHSMIFLPCHKSHVDYVVISYVLYRLGIGLPHIAAGENLNIPLVGPMLKYGGAFFLRRSFGNDQLYQQVFKEYIELLLRRGLNIEVFIEGTRSRTGKLLNPRFGVLKIILDALLSGKINDAIICPISIDYDKVIETESYVTELLGNPKQQESLMGILNNANILSLKFGRIDIRFAKPFSLRSWVNDQKSARTTQEEIFAPIFNKMHQSIILQSLGYRVLSDINAVSVIMPTALVGCVVLTLRGRGVGRDELIRRVTWLRREILIKGGRVADFGGAKVSSIVDRALNALSAALSIRHNLLEPVIYPTKRFELSLYRNQVIHHFVHESFVCASMYSIVKKGRTHLRIIKDQLLSDVVFLSRILKGEFIFRPGPIELNLNEAVRLLHNHGVVDIEDLDGRPWTDQIVDISELPADYLVRLSDTERRIGRENFDFYCFLIWPFIETYWLAAVSLFTIIPTPSEGGLTEKMLMDRVQLYARTLYYEGDLGYFESISKETIKNAFKRYQDMGIMRVHTAHSQPAEGEFEGSRMDLYSVEPDYERECALYLNDPQIFTSETFSPNLGIYKTRLWAFVETIGKYRREGKHRRDNEVTGLRVLRLASMARFSTLNAKGKL